MKSRPQRSAFASPPNPGRMANADTMAITAAMRTAQRNQEWIISMNSYMSRSLVGSVERDQSIGG